MNKFVLIIIFISGFGMRSHEQIMLAAWTFDTLSASPNTPKSYPSTLGAQSQGAFLYSDGTNGASNWSSNELNSFAGTVNNDPRGSSALAGKAYSLQNTTANGKSIVLKFFMTGYQGAVLTYVTQKTSTGFSSQQWAFSIDSLTFTNVGSAFTPPGSFSIQTLDLSGITQINGSAKVWLRMTVTGCSSASGNNRLDNLVINASVLTILPSKLTINNINSGVPPVAGTPFTVVVQSQDAGNNAANVISDVGVVLVSGTGTLGGTITGIIPAGQSSAIITGVTMTEGYAHVITAHQVSGTPPLADGNSPPFNVIAAVPDYRTTASGNWSLSGTWQILIAGNWYDAWDYPDASNKNATILTGHTVVVTDNNGKCNNLTINTGGKLWVNSNVAIHFLDIYGNISDNGIIGSSDNGATIDMISFNIDGINCIISGFGNFDAGRISKNTTEAPITTLSINMALRLRYPGGPDASLCNAQQATTTFNIVINPGFSVTCQDARIDLTGCTLTLRSDITGMAGIIDNGTIVNNTNVSVEQFITGYSLPGDSKYHILSSPINGQIIRPEFVSDPPNPADDFYKWDEPTSTWINSKNISGSWNASFENNFVTGRGYMVAYPTNIKKVFNGSLNTFPASSPLILNCSWTDPVKGGSGGWNMCGNPFPSSVDWNLVSKGDGIDNALYYYDPVIENYRYYIQFLPGISVGNGSQFIPPGQGFFVHANNMGTNKTLAIDNTMRSVTGISTWYKENQDNLYNCLNLKVDNGINSDETFVLFIDGATSGFDGEFDALKLASINPNVPELYTLSTDTTGLAINTLPLPVDKTIVPLEFKPGPGGNYSLTSSGLNSFIPGISISLEDVKTGITQNLVEDPVYNFISSEGDDPGRFLLHFSGLSGIHDPADQMNIHIYSFDQSVTIKRSSPAKGARVIVYDLRGDIVLISDLPDKPAISFDLAEKKGYFLVKVVNGNDLLTAKVFLE